MKKILFVILTLVIYFIIFSINNSVKAVTAYPYPGEFTQPDGSKISILLKGDEKVKWAETTDGYSIIFNKNGAYEYAMLDSKNDMIPSGIQAKNQQNRSLIENNFLSTLPKSLHFSSTQVQLMKSAWDIYKSENAKSFPTTGNRNLFCILIGFTDVSFTKTQSDFNNLFNQINYSSGGATGSVKDYYLENSYNQFNLTVTVAGPYTASHNMAYYGANYGGQGTDVNPGALVTEALNLANPNVNYANFDNDNDGSVDAVYIIFAGYGEEVPGVSPNAIWSHASYINPITLDGKTINRYSCSPELRGNSGSNITSIGVICHEFGHILGAPDFYDTDKSANGWYSGTGQWDIMASGNWNNGGITPAHHNAYTKTTVYNWASVILLTSSSQITLNNSAQNYNSFYRYNTATSNEYFLLENRQLIGFDSEIPGHGMIIYHVDGTYINNYGIPGSIGFNTINASSHQGFYPVCADASGNPPSDYGIINSDACPFPGTANKTSFTDSTIPNSLSWAQVNTAKPITSITEDYNNKTVSFTFMGGAPCIDVLIDNHPSDQNVAQPSPASYSVIVSGTAPSYQWQYSSNGGSSWDDVPTGNPYSGTTSSVLYINNTSLYMHNNQYRCYVYNSCPSSQTSDPATLYVTNGNCNFSLSQPSEHFSSIGGFSSFNIYTSASCNWSAVSNEYWININSGSSGTGNWTINYSVDPNLTSNSLVGSISIADQIYTITQDGTSVNCAVSIIPAGEMFIQKYQGSYSFVISINPTCSYSILSTEPSWLTINIFSNNVVYFDVSANNSYFPRTGYIYINDVYKKITQEGNASGIDETSQLSNVTIFPNPTTSELNIEMELTEATDFSLTLLNSTGQVIWSEAQGKHVGKYLKVIDMRKYGKGIYSLQIKSIEGIINRKVIVI